MEIVRNDTHDTVRSGPTALAGLLAIQAIIGYVWLMSGLTKVFRGGFPSGLADELKEKSEGLDGWYKSFLDGTVIPNADVFGWLIMLGELAVGVALIAAAAAWFIRWDRFGYRGRTAVLAVTAVAAFAAILMNVNFHLANGSAHPWLIPEDGFDEGVDLDSIMPLVQLVLVAVSARLLVLLRRERSRRAPTPAADPARQADRATVSAGEAG